MKTGGRYYFYHNDHLGTPQKMTDVSGAVVWSAKSESFGETVVEVATVENNLRFPGQYYDSETGLHYNWFRYYDSNTGRYLRVDPIGLAGGINLYAYCLNDPVNFVDPWGLAKLTIYAERNGPGSSGFANGTGHVFIEGTYDDRTSERVGWRPEGVSKETDKYGNISPYDVKHTFEVTDDQAKTAVNSIREKNNEWIGYEFYIDNCTDAVEDALDAASIDHPWFGFPSNPDNVADWLDELNTNDNPCP